MEKREIKFRSWNIKKKVMQYNPILDYFAFPDGGLSYGHGKEAENPLMQYTGLKDKSGKEIYEGDLCKKDSTFPIEVMWGKSGWKTRYGVHNEPFEDIFLNEMEIIGNIYENPELIK